jgi:7-cyano-7-deazaguanine synthase
MSDKKFCKQHAVVLLSGGLDSATALFVARCRGFKTACLIFDYGQRHRREIGAAKALARCAKSPFFVVKIKLPWKGSALLDRSKHIPTAKSQAPRADNLIPSTYVPGRNTIFLSYALSYAEASGAAAIFIGANAVDYSGYPDCRPQYLKAFAEVSRQGTRRGIQGRPVRIEAPLIRLSKGAIIRLGMKLGVPYALSWSCYKGGEKPCGVCDSCRWRAKGFKEAGLKDPALKITP